MDEMKKYDELAEKAETIRSVGKKLTELIHQNQSSIDWYVNYAAEKVAENPGFDAEWCNENIAKLEKENAMIREVEALFWKKYVF